MKTPEPRIRKYSRSEDLRNTGVQSTAAVKTDRNTGVQSTAAVKTYRNTGIQSTAAVQTYLNAGRRHDGLVTIQLKAVPAWIQTIVNNISRCRVLHVPSEVIQHSVVSVSFG